MIATHTYVIVELSDRAYTEIADKLMAAGYSHVFHQQENRVVIDMHGLSVARESIVPESKEQARLIYQEHVNACRVCRAPESPICEYGRNLHNQWIPGSFR